jgi:hypothetical protein
MHHFGTSQNGAFWIKLRGFSTTPPDHSCEAAAHPPSPSRDPISPNTHRRTDLDSSAPTANTDHTDDTPATAIQALHRQHAFQATRAPFFPKKNWEKISEQQVSPKFIEGFCCLKRIESFYCAFGWLLVDSEVVKKPTVLLSISFEFVDL